MRPGHRGLNYPVRDETGGRGAITAQHHAFVVSRDGLADGVEITHTNCGNHAHELQR